MASSASWCTVRVTFDVGTSVTLGNASTSVTMVMLVATSSIESMLVKSLHGLIFMKVFGDVMMIQKNVPLTMVPARDGLASGEFQQVQDEKCPLQCREMCANELSCD